MKNIKFRSIISSLFILLILCANNAFASFDNIISLVEKPEVIIIHNKNVPLHHKEALIILPGLEDSKKGRRNQKEYFEQTKYDLYIPLFLSKNSFDQTVENFAHFYESNNLASYKKVHVISYILGSWVLNTYINEYGHQNISTIIYDRSPLQERAPRVVRDRIPLLGRLAKGKILDQLSHLPYPSINKEEINIGIIVENKATRLIRHFKKQTLSYGPINWDNLDFKECHDDLFFVPLNHDQMYTSFDIIGEDILHFIQKGTFKEDSKRTAYKWDVFKK